jgi:hypothetical protein
MAVLRRCSARPVSSLCSVARAQSPECPTPRSLIGYCTCAQMPVRRCLCGYCRARRSGSAMHLHDIAHCGPCVHVGLNVASGHPCDPLVHTIACPGCVAPCCRLRYQGGVLELVVCCYACRALCPRGVRPLVVQLQCDLSSMGAAALAARLGPLRCCSSPVVLLNKASGAYIPTRESALPDVPG